MTQPVPRREADGSLVVPARAEGPNGIVGDGVITLRPGDAGFDEWDRWMRELHLPL